jgi:hypothetical protein
MTEREYGFPSRKDKVLFERLVQKSIRPACLAQR